MKLLSFGAVLWDIIEGTPHIGGAPFNLAAHAARLGMEAHLVSAIGDDELGRRARAAIRRAGVGEEFVRVVEAPTGVVDVTVDAQGRPSFTIRYPAAWDFIQLSDEDLRRLREARFDVICYGSLEQRSPATNRSLRRLVEGAAPAMRFCDINLRPPFFNRESVEWSLRSADILKLNDDEARVTGELLNHPLQGLEDFCRWASAAFNIQTLCVTRGAEGCLVYRGGKAVRCPGVRVHVVDTVGSGDAFSAAFIARLLAGASAEQAGQFANKVGALVASRRGAVPEYDPREIEG